MRSTLLLPAAMLALTLAAHAQPAAIDRSTPEAVARHYFEAKKGDRYDEIIALTYPAVLDSFKARLMPEIERSATSRTKSGRETYRVLGRSRTIEAIRAMPPAEFAFQVLYGVKELWGEPPPFQVDGMILGHVMEGDDIAHVVYRSHFKDEGAALAGIEFVDAEVIRMRRDGDAWYLAAPRELATIAFAFIAPHGSAPPSGGDE